MTQRIALVSEHASPLGALGGVDSGGQNVYVAHVAKQLAARGYDVEVLTRRDAPSLPEEMVWTNGIRIVHVPAGPARFVHKEALLPFMDEFAAYVRERAARRRYYLLHANFWMSGLVAAEVKRALGIPFVVTFHALGRVRRLHQGDADGWPDERLTVEDRIVAEADHLIAECPQDEQDLITLYGAAPVRITVVPCGFDGEELGPIDTRLARLTLGLDPDEPILLQLGRMVPRKGVDTAIRALGRLVRDHGLARGRLLVVGGETDEPDPARTPEIGRLQAIAAEEGVSDRVTFVGRRDRSVLKYYYSAADVFITTPWYEPFGITPVEAMACGTPVVGANVGGIKFSVRDGESGFLVPPNDPAAVADRVATLYRAPDLLEQMSRQAIRRAKRLFTWEKVADGLEAVYREATRPEALPLANGAGSRVTRPLNGMSDLPFGAAATPPDACRQASRSRARRASDLAAVERGFAGAAAALEAARVILCDRIVEAADWIAGAFDADGRLLICGNGGSAADAQHFAGELVGRFKDSARRALPALALTADTAVLTAWANDFGYEDVFARQVEAFGRPGDVLVGISTSGRSANVVRAFERARALGLRTIALVGGDGGDLARLADQCLIVPSRDTQHIQAAHIVAIHTLCELVEARVTQSAEAGHRQARPAENGHAANGTASSLINGTVA